MKNTLKPENHLVRKESRWFALYTRYKREKQVLQRLSEQGVEAYLPLRRNTRQYGKRIRHSDIPLLSCYIFTKITLKEYVRVLQTPDVVDFVKFSNNLIAIPEREIQLLRRVVDGVPELEIEPYSYQVGDKVIIASGPLTGIRGTLVERKDKKNFIVELHNIGYSLLLHVAPSMLKKAS